MRIAQEEVFGPVLAVIPFERRGGRDPHRQRRRLRPCGRRVDAEPAAGDVHDRQAQGRHRLGQQLPRDELHLAVRRLQATPASAANPGADAIKEYLRRKMRLDLDRPRRAQSVHPALMRRCVRPGAVLRIGSRSDQRAGRARSAPTSWRCSAPRSSRSRCRAAATSRASSAPIAELNAQLHGRLVPGAERAARNRSRSTSRSSAGKEVLPPPGRDAPTCWSRTSGPA